MATILFTALGTLFGGPIGGALGALAGRQVDAAIIGSPTREGPRLKDLTVSTSTYGDVLARHFGTMRVAGSIIWATDLVEKTTTSGGGKGKPKVKSFSYSSSFAVALSSRKMSGIGRIWADGKLLRGAGGDLKVGGSMRLYRGTYDQMPDPLMAAAEGSGRCPAYRGLAYVVFEDLQLGDYGNRIPSLSFEVIADNDALTLGALFEGVIEDVDGQVPLDQIAGYSCDSALNDTLAKFQPFYPMDCDAGGERLVITPARLQASPIALGEAAVSPGKGDFGANYGFSRKRAGVDENPPSLLRYYDVDRDYQPGTQRAPGQAMPGQPRTVELPAAMTAVDAKDLIAHTAKRVKWARETLAWRSVELDPAVGPGAVVRVPGQAGRWRVQDWEWREAGVELSLERMAPAAMSLGQAVSSGQANVAADLLATPTRIMAFELPWDGVGSSDSVGIYAALSSVGAGWSGAELFVESGDGALHPIGVSGRERSTMGVLASGLPVASPMMIDRSSAFTVQLVAAEMSLANATLRQLAAGANRALIGEEIIQFGRAEALGNGLWRLSQLLRGRGGSEQAIVSHDSGVGFVLLDNIPVALDAAMIGSASDVKIAAMGL
ncbi:MAG: hypothetical protein RLY97_1379, partial [Pseudomonadota bacterium]